MQKLKSAHLAARLIAYIRQKLSKSLIFQLHLKNITFTLEGSWKLD
uniref:Uncharacterized protein n=1 Tax=Rhizophora mucronata TaxID=61149 RepID=A0A2P2QUA3_RHIMU